MSYDSTNTNKPVICTLEGPNFTNVLTGTLSELKCDIRPSWDPLCLKDNKKYTIVIDDGGPMHTKPTTKVNCVDSTGYAWDAISTTSGKTQTNTASAWTYDDARAAATTTTTTTTTAPTATDHSIVGRRMASGIFDYGVPDLTISSALEKDALKWLTIPDFKKKKADIYMKKNMTVKRVVFNDPATIVFWGDGTKTVVKCSPGETFNKYYGFCAAVTKRIFENNSRVNKIVKEGFDETPVKKSIQNFVAKTTAVKTKEKEESKSPNKKPSKKGKKNG